MLDKKVRHAVPFHFKRMGKKKCNQEPVVVADRPVVLRFNQLIIT